MTIKPINNLFPLYAYQEGMEWNTVYFNAPGISLCMACGDCTAACSEGAIRIKRGFNAGFFFCKFDSAFGIKPAEQILMYKDEINETTETFSIP